MQRFKNILLVLNTSRLTGPATHRALELAKSNSAGLKVIDFLHFNPLGRSFRKFSERMESLRASMVNERRRELEEFFLGQGYDIPIHIEVLTGKPFVEIIRCVLRLRCDLLIKEADDDKPVMSRLFGSTDLRLLRKCPCPVWIMKPGDHEDRKKILAAVELEVFEDNPVLKDLNRQIVEIASSMALNESAELHFVNAWIVFDGERLAKKLSKHYQEEVAEWVEEQKKSITSAQLTFQKKVRKYLQDNGMDDLSCTFHFLEGEAEDVIVDLVQEGEMDLVVMGTVARTDLAGFLVGNTSEAILSHINCSVLAVKPAGFVSPITVDDK